MEHADNFVVAVRSTVLWHVSSQRICCYVCL